MISIVIAYHKQGSLLKDLLKSIPSASINLCEIIIVNYGSSKEDWIADFKDLEAAPYRVIHQQDQGYAHAANSGIEQSKSPFILAFDLAQNLDLTFLEQADTILQNKEEIGVVSPRIKDSTKGIYSQILAANGISNNSVFRKCIWEKAQGFDSKLVGSSSIHWEMWVSAIAQNAQFHSIDSLVSVQNNSIELQKEGQGNKTEVFEYLLSKHENVYRQYYREVTLYLAQNSVRLTQSLLDHSKIRGSLASELAEAKSMIIHYEEQLKASIEGVQSLQSRVDDFEKSLFLKFKRKTSHMNQRMKSNASSDIGRVKYILMMLKKENLRKLRELVALVLKHIYLTIEPRSVFILESGESTEGGAADPYSRWFNKRKPGESEMIKYNEEADDFAIKPRFSIIIPIFNPDLDFFEKSIQSIDEQSYENWELCIADNNSTNANVKKRLQALENENPRIKVAYLAQKGQMAKASNSALALASGDYIITLKQEDLLSSDALFQLAKKINEQPKVDLIYTDEDKIDKSDFHFEPTFKPQWSPDNLLSRNYIGHISIYRKSIMDEINGWREGFDGSQDYDLLLRFTEKTQHINHIPMVIFHCRVHGSSTDSVQEAMPSAYMAAQKALSEALQRRGEEGKVSILNGSLGYSIRYEIKDPSKKVSIIIPTKDKADLLQTCFDSLFEKTTYQNFEIVLLDNNSSEKSFFDFVDKWKTKEPQRFKYVEAKVPFNFANLMNIGFKHADGDYIVLLNNDTEILSPDWLEGMIEQAQRPSVGVVGCKLLFPNNTIQHAGVVIGIGGIAGHVFIGMHRNGPGHLNMVNLINNYSAVTAACCMFRRDVFADLEGFDENYAVDYNDVDFCLRVRENGYNNVYLPHVELYHHESISRGHPYATKESLARHQKESEQFKAKWKKYISNDPCYSPHLTLKTTDFSLRS